MERGIHILITLCSVLAVGRCVLVVGSSGPLLAVRGDDITLPCSLRPPENAEDMTVDWTRSDLTGSVHLYQHRRENLDEKNPSYKYRTMLFSPDELKKGNVSLKLFRVTLSDEGNYTCLIPSLDSEVKEVTIQFSVVAVSQPVISILGLRDGYVDLQCEATTNYPDAQMTWLNRDGHALFGNVSYSTDRYTVRSIVTVKETDIYWLSCGVELETKKSDPSVASDKGVIISVFCGIGLFCLLCGVIWCYCRRQTTAQRQHIPVPLDQADDL